jgi:hypothetical protein
MEKNGSRQGNFSEPHNVVCSSMWETPVSSIGMAILRRIYTTQLLPKTVACNLLTTWVVLCKSSTQLAYVVVDELCLWFRRYNLSCKQVACDSFRQKLCSINPPFVFSCDVIAAGHVIGNLDCRTRGVCYLKILLPFFHPEKRNFCIDENISTY